VSFCTLVGFREIRATLLVSGETRTRDLCRDSGPSIGFTATYKTAGTAKGRLSRQKSRKTTHSVGRIVGWKSHLERYFSFAMTSEWPVIRPQSFAKRGLALTKAVFVAHVANRKWAPQPNKGGMNGNSDLCGASKPREGAFSGAASFLFVRLDGLGADRSQGIGQFRGDY
jgi:hypothetical protein